MSEARTRTRRPLPGLVFLLVLLLVAAVVWWRVLHSNHSGAVTVSSDQPHLSLSCAPTQTTLPSPQAVQVAVLNANGTAGLAKTVTGQLQTRGFAVQAPGDTDLYSGVAQIRFGKKGRQQAQVLSYYVPGATFRQDTRSGSMIDLVLGGKFDKVGSITDAKAAIAKAETPC